MITLATHYFPRCNAHDEMTNLTFAHHEKVANSLGWKFMADRKRRVPDKQVYREKAAFLMDCMSRMDDGDGILWVDADALVIGKNTPAIFDVLGKADIGMVKFSGNRWNSGTIAMRVNVETRNLWSSILDHEHRRSGPWIDSPLSDQMCEKWDANECADCPWRPEDRGPLCGSHKVRVVELEKKWNEKWFVLPDTEIVGFHLLDGVDKLRRIRKALGVEGRSKWRLS